MHKKQELFLTSESNFTNEREGCEINFIIHANN